MKAMKKINNKILLIIILITALTSCQRDKIIELDLPPYDSKFVVYCILYSDSIPYLYLSESIPYLDNSITLFDSINEDYCHTALNYFVQDAIVIISNEFTIDTLELDSAAEFWTDCPEMEYFYRGHEPIDSEKKYELYIFHNDKEVRAETKVPKSPVIIGFDAFLHDDTICCDAIDIFFEDDPYEKNYYMAQWKAEFYTKWDWDYPHNDEYGINAITIDNPLLVQDPVYISLQSLNKEAYEYLLLINDQENSFFDPYIEAINLKSNIQGGLGVFGAVATSPSEKVYP